MRFDSYMPVINGAVDPDPIAAPGNVPNDKIVVLRRRDPEEERTNQRIIIGLEGVAGEDVDFELYVLDSLDEDEPAANRHWYLVAQVAGLAANTLTQVTTNYIGEGSMYVRVTAETVTANRRLVLRSTV